MTSFKGFYASLVQLKYSQSKIEVDKSSSLMFCSKKPMRMTILSYIDLLINDLNLENSVLALSYIYMENITSKKSSFFISDKNMP